MAAKTKTMKTRSKASKTLAEALRRENNATAVKTGTVTAVRWDGTVNLTVGGVHFVAVACAQSYADRKPGDRVQIIMHGGMPFVLGSVGGDPNVPSPEIYPTDVKQFSWARPGGDIRLYVNEGTTQRIGRPGDGDPVYPGDVYYEAVYSYWDGVANTMNDPADTAQSMDIFLARDDWDEGDLGPANLTLTPHKMDAIPNDPASILYQIGLDPPRLDFTLETGEMKIQTLPDTWRDNIGAATLTADTIRGFTISPQAIDPAAPKGSRMAVDNSHAILTNITAALRIYTS